MPPTSSPPAPQPPSPPSQFSSPPSQAPSPPRVREVRRVLGNVAISVLAPLAACGSPDANDREHPEESLGEVSDAAGSVQASAEPAAEADAPDLDDGTDEVTLVALDVGPLPVDRNL